MTWALILNFIFMCVDLLRNVVAELLGWNPYRKVNCFRDPIASGIGPKKPQPTNALKNRKKSNIPKSIIHFVMEKKW